MRPFFEMIRERRGGLAVNRKGFTKKLYIYRLYANTHGRCPGTGNLIAASNTNKRCLVTSYCPSRSGSLATRSVSCKWESVLRDVSNARRKATPLTSLDLCLSKKRCWGIGIGRRLHWRSPVSSPKMHTSFPRSLVAGWTRMTQSSASFSDVLSTKTPRL